MNNPLISVVVPIYNKEEYLHRAVTSVLSQSYHNFELILVCDPSTDNSNQIAKGFTDTRIRIIERSEPGAGGYAARNAGIKESKGQWICFLDADDEYLEHRLKEHVNLIQHTKKKLVATSWIDIERNGKESGFQKKSEKTEYNFNQAMINYTNWDRFFHTNTISVERSLFKDYALFPEKDCRRGGDVYTWLELLYQADGVCYNGIASAKYHRESSDVTVSTQPELQCNCVYRKCTQLLQVVQKSETRKVIKEFSNKHITFGLISRARAGRLRLGDVQMLYLSVHSPLKTAFYISFSLLPGPAQRIIWKGYLKWKT